MGFIRKKLESANLFKEFVLDQVYAREAHVDVQRTKGIAATVLFGMLMVGFLAGFVVYNSGRADLVPYTITSNLNYATYKAIAKHGPECECANPSMPFFGTRDVKNKLIKDSAYATPIVAINPVCQRALWALTNCTHNTTVLGPADQAMCTLMKGYFYGIKGLCDIATEAINNARTKAMKTRLVTPVMLHKSAFDEAVESVFTTNKQDTVQSFKSPLKSISVLQEMERPITSIVVSFDETTHPRAKWRKDNPGQPDPDYFPLTFEKEARAYDWSSEKCDCFRDWTCSKSFEVLDRTESPTKKALNIRITCSEYLTMRSFPMELFEARFLKALKKKLISNRRRLEGLQGRELLEAVDSDLAQDNPDFFPGVDNGRSYPPTIADLEEAKLRARILEEQEEAEGRRLTTHPTTPTGTTYGSGTGSGPPSYGSGSGYPSGPPSYGSGSGPTYTSTNFPTSPSSYTFSEETCDEAGKCFKSWLGDGYCDRECNNKACSFDFDPNSGQHDCAGFAAGEGMNGGPTTTSAPPSSFGFSHGPPPSSTGEGSGFAACYPYCGGDDDIGGPQDLQGSDPKAIAGAVKSTGKTTGPLSEALDQAMIDKFAAAANHEAYFNACQPKQCKYTVFEPLPLAVIFSLILGLLGGLSVSLKTIAKTLVVLAYKAESKRETMAAQMHMGGSRRKDLSETKPTQVGAAPTAPVETA